MQREPPLARILPRQPGTKEARYKHLFSPDVAEADTAPAPAVTQHDTSSFSELENEVRELRKEIADLKQQFASFRRQFE
jgi:hypothetical protein